MDRGGGGGGITIHDFPSKFLSHCTEIFYWRTLWCFRKILLTKIFMHRRGGITVLSKLFVSQDRNEKFCKGTLLFSGNFPVSKKFMDKRGHITIFSQNFYVSQCRKISSGNPTVFEKIFGFKKFYGSKGGYHDFQSKFLCLTVPKNFVGISSMFQKIWGIEKFYA